MSESTAVHTHTATIVVNGQPKTVPSREVSWNEVVDLAFPGEREDENYTFVVSYSDAKSDPHSGILKKDGKVEVEEQGTSFNVARHRRS